MSAHDEDEEVKAFSCRVENVKTITDILNCLCIDVNKAQPCDVEATPDTLFFIVTGKGKATQARVGFQSELFEEYICESESVKFAINLKILIDCLQIFGASSETTAATMSYSNTDALFKVSLEDAGVITTCDINSLYSEDFDELQQGLFVAFREHSEECQIIIKSDALRDCVQELTDALWAGSVQVQVHNRPMFMKLSTGGMIGMSEINIPRSSDAYVSFRCSTPLEFTYPLKSLVLGMKALSVSKETYIRINTQGIMCVQHQIETPKGAETFLDFLMVAEECFDDADVRVAELATILPLGIYRFILVFLVSIVAIQRLSCFKIRLPLRTIVRKRNSNQHRSVSSLQTGTNTTPMEEKNFSLVFCRRTCEDGSKEVLLGMKKRGFGTGKWNGYGGKLESTETIEQCAVRELEEESGIVTTDIHRRGYIVFKMVELNQMLRVHVYETWNFVGEAVETEEMRPQWYKESDIPYDKMWLDDKYWLPHVLAGKSILARFEFEDEETITEYDVKVQD